MSETCPCCGATLSPPQVSDSADVLLKAMRRPGPRDPHQTQRRHVYRINGQTLWTLTFGTHRNEPSRFTYKAVHDLAKAGKIRVPTDYTSDDYYELA